MYPSMPIFPESVRGIGAFTSTWTSWPNSVGFAPLLASAAPPECAGASMRARAHIVQFFPHASIAIFSDTPSSSAIPFAISGMIFGET